MKTGVFVFFTTIILFFSGCGDGEDNPLTLTVTPNLSPILQNDAVPCEEFRLEEEVLISAFRVTFARAAIEWDPGENDRELTITNFNFRLDSPSVGGTHRDTMNEEYLNFMFGIENGFVGTATRVLSRGSCSVQFGGISLASELDTPAFSASARLTLFGISSEADGSNPRTERAEVQTRVQWTP